MSVPGPSAGLSHTVKFKYANDTKEIGLVIPDITGYSRQPYTPFAPATRQGEATQRDFSITSVWEIENDWSGGTGHLIEDQTAETQQYAFAQGQDLSGTPTIGPCLFTAQPGRVYPPAAETLTSAIANFKQFIEFGTKLYALTSDAAGKIYQNDGSVTWTLVETLTAAGTQLFTDGTTLFACQGAANPVRKTTDGTTWANHTYNAHFIAKREENNTSYITTATLTPNNDGTGPSYRSPVIGMSGTTATAMVYYNGKLWIGKPEGLYTWEQGWIEEIENTQSQRDTSNFKFMCVYKGLLFYNIKSKLYFTNGDRRTEIVPEDLNGFTAIDSMFASAGPLLIGARMQGRSYLFYFAGVEAPGLNPLWSDADATRPIVACAMVDLFTRPRVYFSESSSGTLWLDFATNYVPNTYHVAVTLHSYIELTVFTAGFRSVPKWFYEVVLNVEDAIGSTYAQVWYLVDGGAWTQAKDENGAIVTLALDAKNKAVFFPLNTTGVSLKLRLFVWTTSASSAAYISAVTVRGIVEPKKRVQISFPVSAGEEVQGFMGQAQDSGRHIHDAFVEMSTQGFPIKLFDYDGKVYLGEFRTPYPLEAITTLKQPEGNRPAEALRTYQVLFTVIDELNADGTYPAWTAG